MSSTTTSARRKTRKLKTRRRVSSIPRDTSSVRATRFAQLPPLLSGKRILLGISGSIAAYKAAVLVRELVRAGAEVQVLMTPVATQFISPLTLSTLSKRPVYHAVTDGAGWNNHVELGLWADAFVIAPATASTLAKLATGQSDNMVVATYLSARCPVWFAPAMDLDMWAHPATQANVRTLQSYGNHLIDVGHGELASGLTGAGRLAEPADIVRVVGEGLQPKDQDLRGKKVLVTAGPTREAIDPVRFLSNPSTGKMGIALARQLADRGAETVLLLGPTAEAPPPAPVRTVRITSAEELCRAALAEWPTADAAILAAAVADYRPAAVADRKVKKGNEDLTLRLVRTPDTAATLGRQKAAHQRLIGFALETDNELANARDKLRRKNFDAIVLNSLRDAGAGFGHATNRVRLLTPDAEPVDYPLLSKTEVAAHIVTALVRLFAK